jgi:hypothetical protein
MSNGNLDAARIREGNICGVCAGEGDPGTGKPCICGGVGTQTAELQGFRERVFFLEDLLSQVWDAKTEPMETYKTTVMNIIRERNAPDIVNQNVPYIK